MHPSPETVRVLMNPSIEATYAVEGLTVRGWELWGVTEDEPQPQPLQQPLGGQDPPGRTGPLPGHLQDGLHRFPHP